MSTRPMISQLNKTSPCTPTCPNRSSTCHATCPDWAKWEEYKRPIYKARELANEIYTSTEHWEAYARRARAKW